MTTWWTRLRRWWRQPLPMTRLEALRVITTPPKTKTPKPQIYLVTTRLDTRARKRA